MKAADVIPEKNLSTGEADLIADIGGLFAEKFAQYVKGTQHAGTEAYMRAGSGGDMKAVRKIRKTALPDITAIIYWLKNRRPEKWRDKYDIDEGAEQSVTIRFQDDAEEASK